MKVIGVGNRKGGVGKTTHSVTLAAGLALQGFNVVLVDFSSQGNIGDVLAIPKHEHLYGMAVERKPILEVGQIVPADRYIPDQWSGKAGRMIAVTGFTKTSEIPGHLKYEDVPIFSDRLLELAETTETDVVIIDTPPETGPLDPFMYFAFDAVALVTHTEESSYAGLVTAIQQIKRSGAYRQRFGLPATAIIGVIPNMVRRGVSLHERNYTALQAQFKNAVLPIVPQGVIWQEASAQKQTIFRYAPHSNEAAIGYEISNIIANRLKLQIKSHD